jgi:hypothetical protein
VYGGIAVAGDGSGQASSARRARHGARGYLSATLASSSVPERIRPPAAATGVAAARCVRRGARAWITIFVSARVGRTVRIFSRVAQVAVAALMVLITVSLVRGARHDPPARPAVAGASDRPELVLGPAGIGKLRLGMSEREAAATGQAKEGAAAGKDGAKCAFQTVDGVNLGFSHRHGLAVITVAGAARTPEGIRPGASVDQVAAAYPDLNHPELGTAAEQVDLAGQFTTPVPGNPDALYVFVFRLGGAARPATAKLLYILLCLRHQDRDCTRAD